MAEPFLAVAVLGFAVLFGFSHCVLGECGTLGCSFQFTLARLGNVII